MDKRQIITTGLLLLVLSGCWDARHHDQKEDKFYSTLGGWDWIRIPLLKPYEAIKTNPELNDPWTVDLQSTSLMNTYNVKKVDVKDSIVYLLSGKVNSTGNDSTTLGTRVVHTAWFVIDVRRGIEEGFSNEKAFRDYIIKNQYPFPQWYDIDSLSKTLGTGKKLPWRPN